MSNFNDSGRWRIADDGRFCRTWKISNGGKADCVTIYQNSDTFYAVTPEGGRATFTIKPGDPDQL